MISIYKLTETKLTDEHGVSHKAFGISVYKSGSAQPIRTVDDIFTNRTLAEDFVSLCNRLELSPDHLDDVISDTLAQI